ncbi:unnamed protein product [Rodentolepis nana]|uniref:Ovule protein n=1 Tax=Rodentolepis nana TaxID=102285 RepID=A0A0R3SZW8_RODNA|nr:unnamed protein product [Rodentolepis nana]
MHQVSDNMLNIANLILLPSFCCQMYLVVICEKVKLNILDSSDGNTRCTREFIHYELENQFLETSVQATDLPPS